jgi:hypothetical protein
MTSTAGARPSAFSPPEVADNLTRWLTVHVGTIAVRPADRRRDVAAPAGRRGHRGVVTFHVTPFGPVGLTMFIAAILLVVRDRSAARAPLPVVEPGVA